MSTIMLLYSCITMHAEKYTSSRSKTDDRHERAVQATAQTATKQSWKKIETSGIDSQSRFWPRSSASIQHPAGNAQTSFPAFDVDRPPLPPPPRWAKTRFSHVHDLASSFISNASRFENWNIGFPTATAVLWAIGGGERWNLVVGWTPSDVRQYHV